MSERKATFKKMLKLFDKAWVDYISAPENHLNSWTKTLEDNKWTDAEFDSKIDEMNEKAA